MSHPWQQGPFLPEEPAAPVDSQSPAAPWPGSAAVSPFIPSPEPAYPPTRSVATAPGRFGGSGAPAVSSESALPVASRFGSIPPAPIGTPAGPPFSSVEEPVFGGWSPQPFVDAPAPVRRKVGPVDAFKRGYRGIFDYRSRATTAEYWWFQGWQALFFAAAYWVDMRITGGPAGGVQGAPAANGPGAVSAGIAFFMLYLLVATLTQVAAAVRRLHDADYSGGWMLLVLAPLGSLALFVMLWMPGSKGRNRFGPVPT